MQRCPDCDVLLSPIRLLQGATGQARGELAYAPADAKPSLWNAAFPVAGSIRALLCAECGRVLLYAVLPRDSFPLPGASAPVDTANLPLAADAPDPGEEQ